MLAADRDRERATAALREHYARGRLTLDELSDRVGRVLAARSQRELRRALSGLPTFPDARGFVRGAVRGALLVVATGAYLMFTFVLLLGLALTLLFGDASRAALAVFVVVWLVPTYGLMRMWHRMRSGPRRSPGW
jgi:hypothetical protein